MAKLVFVGDETVEDLNLALGYVREAAQHAKTSRLPALAELMDDLLDEKNALKETARG